MLDTIISIIAPHTCSSCGETGSILCEYCKDDIINERFERCIQCLRPAGSGICRSCRNKTGISEAWCVGERTAGLQNLLDAYKFRSSKEAARHITDMLDATLPIIDGLTICPVPTAPNHRRVRGFDHVELFAKALSKHRHLPYAVLLEQTSNDIQHFKNKSERAAAVERSIRSYRSSPKRVLLVDDIITTGATIQACTRRLYESGAERVDVLVVARQMLD